MNSTFKHPGTYKVTYEKTSSAAKIDAIISIQKHHLSMTGREIGKDLLASSFDMFRDVILIKKTTEFNGPIAIVPYDNEDAINEGIDKGYHIREFVKDKCIMQRNIPL